MRRISASSSALVPTSLVAKARAPKGQQITLLPQ